MAAVGIGNRHSFWTATAAILIAGGVAVAVGVVWSQSGVPSLTFTQVDVKLAPVVQGEVAKHAFRYTNTSDVSIVLTKVRPQCGCTKAVPTLSRVDPGQSGELRVEIDTVALRAKTDPSPEEFETTIRIGVVTDSSKTDIDLSLLVVIRPEFLFPDGEFMDFGALPAREPSQKILPIQVSSDTLEVLGISSTDKTFVPKLTRVGPKDYQISTSIAGNATLGRHFGTLHIKTSSKILPELRVPVRVAIGP
jgi:hypothetical protein